MRIVGLRSKRRGSITAAIVAAVVVAATAVSAGAAEPAPGTGKPPSGSGINTAAALRNPVCDKSQGIAGYGKVNFVQVGGWPDPGGAAVCVAEWTGKDNGGATSQGVTADSIKVVALVPDDSNAPASQRPRNNATGQPGTMEDALQDSLAAFQHVFETYGRTVELEVVNQTGTDEAAQRADAVTVVSKKPFAVIVASASARFPIFESEVAKAKILVFGAGASLEETQAQAPYRWGQADVNASAMNVAEFAGKQLAGKKAEYAGDDATKKTTRKFGVVYNNTQIDESLFMETAKKYGLKVDPGAVISYDAQAGVDTALAQQVAPTAISKLKDLGVTTVILLADSIVIGALTNQATSQGMHPEWIMSGFGYSELAVFGRGYDQEQWSHAFGLSNLPPISPASSTNTATTQEPVQWYWGVGKGTTSIAASNALNWVMSGIQYAGPKLTPQTFQQGWFAVPAEGGAPSGLATSVAHGYGKTPGLPYDEYLRGTQDFTTVWWDPVTASPALAGQPPAPGTLWKVDGGKRYYAGHWPTKPIKFFDTANSIYEFPTPPPVPAAVPCKGCPSETGAGGSSTG